MTKTYKKPVVSIDTGMAEGVYAASGQGTLNVTYHGVWDRWGTNGGKGLAMADWSGINGTITLTLRSTTRLIRRKRMMHLYRLPGPERLLRLSLPAQQQIR